MTRLFSAGGCVFRQHDGQAEWLVTKPRKSEAIPQDRYTLPKGVIENGETPEEAAVREVEEETGIKALVIQKIGYGKSMYTVSGETIFKINTYYLMSYRSGEPTENEEVEKVLWLELAEAKKLLSYSTEKEMLQKAFELVQLGTAGEVD